MIQVQRDQKGQRADPLVAVVKWMILNETITKPYSLFLNCRVDVVPVKGLIRTENSRVQ